MRLPPTPDKTPKKPLSYYAGRAAADTLGFIAGDLPGMYGADRMYNSYYSNRMKRKAASLRKAGTKRRKTVKRGKRSQGKGVLAPRKTDRTATVVRVGKKKLVKNVKTARVTKKFKTMVVKALAAENSSGHYTSSSIGIHHFTGDNTQKYIIRCSNVTNDDLAFFTPARVLDAASILFNSKAPALDYTTAGNFTLPAAGGGKIHVKNQWVRETLLNNSQHTYHVIRYECMPKNQTSSQPVTAWIQAIDADTTNVKNLGSNSVEVLFTRPSQCSSWMREYAYKATEFEMDPGERKTFTTIGPKKTYNYAEQFELNVLSPYKKGESVLVFYIWYPDIQATSTGMPGRHAPINAIGDNGFTLLHEIYRGYDIEMPDVALETAAKNVYRHFRSYAVKTGDDQVVDHEGDAILLPK